MNSNVSNPPGRLGRSKWLTRPPRELNLKREAPLFLNVALRASGRITRGPREPLVLLALLLLLLFPTSLRADTVLVVTSAGGTPEYGARFAEWAGQWQKAASAANATATVLGLDPARLDIRDALRDALAKEKTDGADPLWLVLLGHGTWDGQTGKFNVAGDDVSIADLQQWLAPIKRPLAVVAAFSSSGAFMKPLAAPGRVIVTATRNGSEENFARFGKYISAAISDPAADIDKDGEVSLLEAWLTAARNVAAFYKDEGRLATEHSLLEDNGDGLGTPPDWFQGTRAVKKAKGAAPDGLRAGQLRLIHSAAENALSPEARAKRDTLEVEVAKLRDRKAEMKEDEYYGALEKLMLEIAGQY